MECATTSTPTAPTVLAQAVFYFPSEHNIPERPEYGKYKHYIDVQGDVLTTPHGTTTAATTSK